MLKHSRKSVKWEVVSINVVYYRFATVYECIHRLDGVKYAIKILNLNDQKINTRMVLQVKYETKIGSLFDSSSVQQ